MLSYLIDFPYGAASIPIILQLFFVLLNNCNCNSDVN